MTRRETEKVLDTIRRFEKRSKHITITRVFEYYGYRITVEVTKENKVTNELKDYLHSICKYHVDERDDKYIPGECFKTFDDAPDEPWVNRIIEVRINYK